LVLTFPEIAPALRVLAHVRRHRPDLPVVVRAADDSHLEELKRAGASEVVPEVLEGSLMLAAQTLTRLAVPLRRVLREIEHARGERYGILRERFRDRPINTPSEALNDEAEAPRK
ncbi:MAG: potassium transporter, partial [Burkholderiales bacterium]|nr:potassium transporter [Burkholderiales bacterium]